MPRRSIGGYLTAALALVAVTFLAVGEVEILQSSLFDQSNSSPSEKQSADKYASCRPVPVLTLAWVPIRTRLCVGIFRNLRFFDAYHDSINAFSTVLVALFTFTLWRTTQKLFIAGERQVEIANRSLVDIQRAFISIEGFNTELTDGNILNAEGQEIVKDAGYSDLSLYITRFAVQPRWKNNGVTAVKNMTIKIDWNNPLRPTPVDYTFREKGTPFFVGPGAVEIGMVFEMPGVQAIINHANKPIGVEPVFLVWGRADYEDVFGKAHITKWCYRVRFDRHDGKRLRAMFIQWGEHNSAD